MRKNKRFVRGLGKLSEKEFLGLANLVSFGLMMHPIRLIFDEFLRYSVKAGANSKESYKLRQVMKKAEAELYEKITALGWGKYLRNYGSEFVGEHLIGPSCPNEPWISDSMKIVDIFFPQKSQL